MNVPKSTSRLFHLGTTSGLGRGLLVSAFLVSGGWAGADNFVSMDYRRAYWQPLGSSHYSAFWRYGNDESIGDATLQSFWEMNSSTDYGAALSRFELSLRDFSALGSRWSLGLGDQDFSTGSSVGGAIGFRGVRLASQWKDGNRTEAVIGLANDLYPAFNQPSFRANRLTAAVSQRMQLSNRRVLRAFLLQRNDTAASRPRSRINSSTSLGGISLEEGTSYGLTTKNYILYSYARRDDTTARSGAAGGTEWQLCSGPSRVSTSFLFVAPHFSGARNDGATGGYQRFSASGSHALLSFLTVMGAYSRHWSQAPGDSDGYWVNSWNGSYGIRFQRRFWPEAVYGFERYSGTTSIGDRMLVRARQTAHHIDIDHRVGFFDWRLGYRHQERLDLKTNELGQTRRYTARGSCRWQALTAFVEQDLERNSRPHLVVWNQHLGIEVRFRGWSTTALGASLTKAEDGYQPWRVTRWSWEASQGAEIGRGWRAATLVRQTRHLSYSKTCYTEWGLKLERSFDNWNHFIGYGVLTGRVFEDENDNGRYDDGEPGIAGIPVLVDGQSRTATDTKGGYSVKGITAGRHSVRIDIKSVRASLNPGGGLERRIWSTGLPGSRLDFPLVPLTAVDGLVFLDADRNGQMDSTEHGLEGIYVLMNGARKFTNSDQDGRFTFHNLEPGQIKFFIDPKFLPDTLEVIGPSEHLVTIEDRKGVDPVHFAIARKQRPVRKIIFSPMSLIEPEAQAQPIPPRASRARTPLPAASPQEIRRLYDLGVKQFSSGEYRGAMETWQRLLRLDPRNQGARRNLQRTQEKLEAIRRAKQ